MPTSPSTTRWRNSSNTEFYGTPRSASFLQMSLESPSTGSDLVYDSEKGKLEIFHRFVAKHIQGLSEKNCKRNVYSTTSFGFLVCSNTCRNTVSNISEDPV